MMALLVSWSGFIRFTAPSSEMERQYLPPGRRARISRSTVSMLWARISGRDSTTVRMASSRPRKSGISTSMEHPGTRSRIWRMVSA
jgi:hypothetical protein